MDKVLVGKGVGLLTRGKAIHARCIDCVGGEVREVKRCSVKGCPLYPYRMGVVVKDKPVNTPIRSKAIKAYCTEWMGSSRDLRKCPSKHCALYKYRTGRRE